MSKEVVIARGIFSRLSISLNEGVNDKLADIPTKDNPLAHIETELKQLLQKFEREYFDAVNKVEVQ